MTALYALHWGVFRQVIEVTKRTGQVATGTVDPMASTATALPAVSSSTSDGSRGRGHAKPRISNGRSSSISRGRGGNG